MIQQQFLDVDMDARLNNDDEPTVAAVNNSESAISAVKNQYSYGYHSLFL